MLVVCEPEYKMCNSDRVTYNLGINTQDLTQFLRIMYSLQLRFLLAYGICYK